MKFSHLRDIEGQLIATIAWHQKDDATAAYGVTYVSGSEPVAYVSPKIGKNKARARCEAAIEGKISHWFSYDAKAPVCTWDEHNFIFLSERLDKLGSLPSEELKEVIIELREYYTNKYRNVEHNEYVGNERIHASFIAV